MRVRHEGRIYNYPTAKFVHSTEFGHDLYTSTDKKEWVATLPLSVIVESGNAPVDIHAQIGLW
jgi:hypothetical protein